MAKEKYIRGKHDDGKHDGLYSNLKRKAEAEQNLRDWKTPETELTPGVVVKIQPPGKRKGSG